MPATVVARMLLDSRYQPGSRPKTFEPTHGHFVFKELAGSRGSCPQGDRWHNSGGKAGARDMMVKGGAVRVRRRYGSVTKRGAINWRFHEYSLVRNVKTVKKQRKEEEEEEVQMAPPLRQEGEEREKEAAAASAVPPRLAVQNVAEEMAAVMAAMSEEQHQHQQQPRPVKDAKATGAGRAAAEEAAEEEDEEDKWEEDRSCAVFHVMPSRPVRGRPKREEEADQATLWAHVAPGLAWELPQTHISADKTTGCVEKAVQAVNVAAAAAAAHVALPTPVLVQSSPLVQAPAAVTPAAVTAAAAAAAAGGVVAADAAEGMGAARTAAATSTLG